MLVGERDDLLEQLKTLKDDINNLRELDWSKTRLADAKTIAEKTEQRKKYKSMNGGSTYLGGLRIRWM
jgi:hypothetical protein